MTKRAAVRVVATVVAVVTVVLALAWCGAQGYRRDQQVRDADEAVRQAEEALGHPLAQ